MEGDKDICSNVDFSANLRTTISTIKKSKASLQLN
jgi:hypothetical protein